MLKTVILVPQGEILPDGVISAYFFLSQANVYLQSVNQTPVFDLEIAGLETTHWVYHGQFGIKATPIEDISPQIDLIIVPGFINEEIPLDANRPLIDWLRDQYQHHNTELASMCTGAFLLAASGALDGKKCTTHWAFAEAFSRLFPHVLLEVDTIITDEEGTYSSGGAFSSLNLLLYLVEKFADKETAVWLSKVFQVDLQRNSQRPFMILNQLYSHEDLAIKRLQEYVEEHYGEELSISGLADQFAFSPRTLVRRFKQATGISPLAYLQQVRMEAAKQLLELQEDPVEEIIIQCGYRDGATFRKIFKRHTGMTPTAYRLSYKSSI